MERELLPRGIRPGELGVSIVSPPANLSSDQAHVLHGVTWDEYVRYRENPANDGLRMTYDRGVLEIMTLSFFHEAVSHLINDFITVWRMHRNIDVEPSGSMTLKSPVLGRGLEGDQSYYIEHAAEALGKAEIDVEQLPPDLVIEVNHTWSSVPKMPIYTALGVPEVWRWKNESLTILRLKDGEYVEQASSSALPGFPLDQLRQALVKRGEVSNTVLIREFQAWLSAPGDEQVVTDKSAS